MENDPRNEAVLLQEAPAPSAEPPPLRVAAAESCWDPWLLALYLQEITRSQSPVLN